MAHTSATTLEARRAALAVSLVASSIASAVVITGMIAVMHGGAATSKNYSDYWTAVTLKESGKVVPIKKVARARSDQLALTRSTAAPARAQITSEFYAVTCGVENVPPAGLVCPANWRPFLVGLPAFEFDFSMGRGNINQHLGG